MPDGFVPMCRRAVGYSSIRIRTPAGTLGGLPVGGQGLIQHRLGRLDIQPGQAGEPVAVGPAGATLPPLVDDAGVNEPAHSPLAVRPVLAADAVRERGVADLERPVILRDL